MKRAWKYILGGTVVAVVAVTASAQFGDGAADIPAYHATSSTAMPPVLGGAQLSGPYFAQPYKAIVYRMAAKIPGVLWQEPCYCRCDREMGHASLHSCFEGTHGAACSTCLREAIYSYQQTRAGRTPAQIRAGIERGEWMKVDYETASLGVTGSK